MITGLSGSGKSAALNTLEDMGYFCIDNLPASTLPYFTDIGHKSNIHKLGITMDVRDPYFVNNHRNIIRDLEKECWRLRIIFLEAETRVIQRRFIVSRRPHPLDQKGSLMEAIRREIKMLSGIRALAHQTIDTSRLAPRALSQMVSDFAEDRSANRPLSVTLLSFGFHHGAPEDADLLVDVRFLPNPFNIAKLRRFNGKHASIKRYVLSQKVSQTFLRHYLKLLKFLLPLYRAEGKSYLTVAIGCTGGQHRSVVLVEALKQKLKVKKVDLHVIHRDITGD